MIKEIIHTSSHTSWGTRSSFLPFAFCLLLFASCFLFLVSCDKKPKQELTPWGTPIGEYSDTQLQSSSSLGRTGEGYFSLADIQSNGELIMLTITGPDTYYIHHGRPMGTQYLLCERFAQHLGVSLRVEVCADSIEILNRLKQGDGDIAVLPEKGGEACPLLAASPELSDTLTGWYKPELLVEVKKDEELALSVKSITRHVYSPMLNRSGGVISRWDYLFQKYAPTARWDWRLLAAQCYQESTFDPQAKSWVGACGLMQIMPSTARHLGLPQDQIFQPEPNIAAAAKLIRELTTHFTDISNPNERISFVLASYNGGFFHIRDAMMLAEKHGRNPHRWQDVSEFVLKLSDPQYYRDPMVKYGYMRGTETVNYVARIRDRWADYCGFARPMSSPAITGEPKRASHKNKFKVQ